VTALWDEMGRVVGRLPTTLETRLLRQLITDLHTYDHEHGGHTLDTYLLGQRHFAFLLDLWKKDKNKQGTSVGGSDQ